MFLITVLITILIIVILLINHFFYRKPAIQKQDKAYKEEKEKEIQRKKEIPQYINCPLCNERIPGEAEYCPHCGRKIEVSEISLLSQEAIIPIQEKVERYFCKNCGKQYNVKYRYCLKCGSEF